MNIAYVKTKFLVIMKQTEQNKNIFTGASELRG